MPNPWLELKKHGQSVWYDNLNRALLVSGDLQRMVDEDGVSGGTSTPSIFEKAMSAGAYYDEDIRRLTRANKDVYQIFDALTIDDIGRCADVFRPVYDEAGGRDGFASLEVSPTLANDTQASISEAHRLFQALARPNALIKIPGTPEGLPAIEQCLRDGINVNITLLFGVANYEQVAWAYVRALEQRRSAGQPIDRIASVASFFVSRVDTLTDERLEQKIKSAGGDAERQELRSLLGQAGIANAKIAYAKFQEIFSSPRWKALEKDGARVQRCLWASTSTKNPGYRDVMYVEGLIGADTVNTVPQATLDAFRDHGIVESTLGKDVSGAFDTIRRLERAGIDFKAVTDELQVQGVQLFADSYQKSIQGLKQKHDALRAETESGIGAARGD